MKKRYTLLFILAFSMSTLVKAQIFPYFFSVETEVNYTPLTDSISLNNGQVWDDPSYIIPLGFEFDFYDFVTDSFYISGEIGVGGFLFPADINAVPVQPMLIAYGSDIIDIGDTSGVSVSEISYKIEGSAGSQIAKIEWKNAGFYNEVDDFGTANNYINFQLWLYEENGDIEIHFGPNEIEDDLLVHDGLGPLIGIISEYDVITDDFGTFWLLTEDEINPSLDTILTLSSVDDIMGLDDDPSNGTVYRFTTSEPVAVIDPIVDQKVSIYPTVVDEFVTIETQDIDLANANLVLFDASGKPLLKQNIDNNFMRLNVQNLAPGMYFINVNTSKGLTTKKMIKQ